MSLQDTTSQPQLLGRVRHRLDNAIMRARAETLSSGTCGLGDEWGWRAGG